MCWERDQGVCCLRSGEKDACPLIPRGGGEEAILSPSASYRTPMDLEPWRGRPQLAEPSETLPLLIGSWASVAQTAKWGRAFCSWNVCSPTPSRSSGDPAFRLRNVLGLRRPGRLGSEAALRLRTQRLGQGAAGPRQGPASGRGLGSFPWRPGLWLLAWPSSASRSGSGDAESVPRGCRGLQAQATGAGLRWWRAGGPGALLRTTKRGRPSCAAPRRAAPALPAPSVSSAADPRPRPHLGQPLATLSCPLAPAATSASDASDVSDRARITLPNSPCLGVQRTSVTVCLWARVYTCQWMHVLMEQSAGSKHMCASVQPSTCMHCTTTHG